MNKYGILYTICMCLAPLIVRQKRNAIHSIIMNSVSALKIAIGSEHETCSPTRIKIQLSRRIKPWHLRLSAIVRLRFSFCVRVSWNRSYINPQITLSFSEYRCSISWIDLLILYNSLQFYNEWDSIQYIAIAYRIILHT